MNGLGAGVFAKWVDRVGGALGLPNTWERRTKAAVLEAYDIITVPPDRPTVLAASAHLFEPAVVHEPTGWKIVFPRKAGGRRLRWLRTTDGRRGLHAGALRDGVWLETRIFEPGPESVAELFEAQASAVLEKGCDAQSLVRTPPGDDDRTPGDLAFDTDRNGAPLAARLLMLGLKGHVVEVFYDTPLRLSAAARAQADAAMALGLESAHRADGPQSTPEELAEAMRGFGMSKEEIAEALKDGEITQP